MAAFTKKENRFRQNIIFEVEDYRSEECVVTCFKKISRKNNNLRMNCFVSQFGFSRSDADSVMKIDDRLQNKEATLTKMREEADMSEDA